jgi:acetolactate synthase small subunit
MEKESVLVKLRATGDFCLPDRLIRQYQLRIADRGVDFLVLEATGIPQDIENLIRLFRPWGVIEVVRTPQKAHDQKTL